MQCRVFGMLTNSSLRLRYLGFWGFRSLGGCPIGPVPAFPPVIKVKALLRIMGCDWYHFQSFCGIGIAIAVKDILGSAYKDPTEELDETGELNCTETTKALREAMNQFRV